MCFWYVLAFYLCITPFFTHAESFLKVEVSAKSAILMNGETGAVLFEKNAYQPSFPASITKMITAMYALEKKGAFLHEKVRVESEAIAAVHPHVRRASTSKHPPYRLEFGGSHMGIKAGEVLSFKDLLYGLMLSSGNDAANMIAAYVSGSIPQFMAELNAYVKSKKCEHTYLHAPHGLPHPEHKTTAYDMALLAREALKIPLFREIAQTVKYVRPASNMQGETILHQHNALVRPGGKFYYPKAIGIKTGYTNAAGYTLVAAAEDSQRTLIAVLLGCEHLDQRYRDAIALFESAFNEKKVTRTLFSREFDFFSSPVTGGKSALQAGFEKDFVIEYFASERQLFHPKVVWEENALPIHKGQRVGEVRIFADSGQLMASSSLFATSDVNPTMSYRAKKQWTACKRILYAHLPLVLGCIGIAIIALTCFLYGRRNRV